ncbi:hypothetical protein MJG53_014713 [Ovis ammon polii x Ovis aries]|uniref:Uncharacterized protein n=1 Tax=Ovis ammon polii x Ovis aries TaxID=2918886 RepID=A0ACB9UHN9_9CETA|nr:hypothetical protein MJG53_014713 [Ovis ammon polii x Ovis aries]
MDARGPLSPRASAFSIASLVAAEAAERTTHLAPGSSEPVKPLGSPAGMHFSTVTRDMEETGAVEPRAEEGVGQERGTRGSRQRGTESSEKWGDRRRAPESRETRRNSERKQEGTAGGKELEKRRGKEDTRAGKDGKETRRARTTEKRREVKKVES